MKVLFIHHASLAGGAERSLFELACAVRDEGVDPVVALPHDGPLAAMLSAAGVSVRLIPMSRLRRTVNPFRIASFLRSLTRGSRRLAELAREVGAEIVHSNSTIAHLYGGEAASKVGVPAVWHVRDIVPLGVLGGRLAKTAARAVAISEFVAAYLPGEGVGEEKIVTIPNGIDLSAIARPDEVPKLRRAARKDLGVHPDSPLVGTVSAVVPWKRPEDFVSAFGRLVGREAELGGEVVIDPAIHRPLRGVYVGDDITGEHPDLLRRLRERSDEIGGDRIVFAGWRDDVPAVLPALDVYVSTSAGEPFGRSVVEAMATGLPVVGPRSGATPELVEDGVTGRLVGEGPAELSSAAMELLLDPGLARGMGEAGRRRASDLFDIRRTAAQVAELHRELIGA